jgi:hypothetical protein
MPLDVILKHAGTGKELHSEGYYHEGSEGRMLLVTTIHDNYGLFKSSAFTAQGTTEMVTPKGNGSIQMTDLIITFEKKGSAVITLNYHDGTNTVTIFKGTVTDAPLNFSSNFKGRWQGWQGAHIDVVITGADVVGNIAIGYVTHPTIGSLPYSDWNAER